MIHFFWPVTKKCLPSTERTAFVLIFATSEPALRSKISETDHVCRGGVLLPRFRDCNANSFDSSDYIRYETILEFLRSKFEDWRKTKSNACSHCSRRSHKTRASHLFTFQGRRTSYACLPHPYKSGNESNRILRQEDLRVVYILQAVSTMLKVMVTAG